MDCQKDDCNKQVYARGWCAMHYKRWLRTGSPIRGERQKNCAVDDCERQRQAQQLCSTHYQRLRQHGALRPDVPIGELPRPPVRRTSKGWITSGYRYVPVPDEERHLTGGRPYEAEHRLAMARAMGRALGDDEQVHHRNGDRLDNRLENLELWSVSQPSGQRVSERVSDGIIQHVEVAMGGVPERGRAVGS